MKLYYAAMFFQLNKLNMHNKILMFRICTLNELLIILTKEIIILHDRNLSSLITSHYRETLKMLFYFYIMHNKEFTLKQGYKTVIQQSNPLKI